MARKAKSDKNPDLPAAPKEAATTKQTGGGGYSFEDQVAAHYLALMLAGLPVLNEQVGTIRKVSFQNKSDGWWLDDILLTVSKNSEESKIALSVKSNQQITSGGFPEDFVKALRKQWKNEKKSVFDRSKDYLGLVVSAIPQNVRRAWDSLLKQAIDADPASVIKRLNTPGATNRVQENLFQSLLSKIDGETFGSSGSCAHAIAEFIPRLLGWMCRTIMGAAPEAPVSAPKPPPPSLFSVPFAASFRSRS